MGKADVSVHRDWILGTSGYETMPFICGKRVYGPRSTDVANPVVTTELTLVTNGSVSLILTDWDGCLDPLANPMTFTRDLSVLRTAKVVTKMEAEVGGTTCYVLRNEGTGPVVVSLKMDVTCNKDYATQLVVVVGFVRSWWLWLAVLVVCLRCCAGPLKDSAVDTVEVDTIEVDAVVPNKELVIEMAEKSEPGSHPEPSTDESQILNEVRRFNESVPRVRQKMRKEMTVMVIIITVILIIMIGIVLISRFLVVPPK